MTSQMVTKSRIAYNKQNVAYRIPILNKFPYLCFFHFCTNFRIIAGNGIVLKAYMCIVWCDKQPIDKSNLCC